jgi:hypothetical protein
MKPFTLVCVGLLCWLFSPVCTGLKAQEARAHVQGVVSDSSGAAIAGAGVTLANVKTGVNMIAQSNTVGLYRFEQVDPGLYTVTIEHTGFSKFRQENFEIRAGGDVTVNASLNPGSIQQTVTVEGIAVEIPFNTTNAALTIDTKMTTELPRFDRNPFKLTLLQPSAVETRRNEMNPYNTYAPNSVELGGGTNLKNDLEVDGSTIGIGYKAAWVPNADAVQEAVVEKNSVDASIGHSAGGTISIATKSGTNELHGSAFWMQRNPALNAVTDRTAGTFVAARNNIFGAAAGHRIIKNKLFNFVSWEAQHPRSPAINLKTMPTALEKTGDFSQSLSANGALRVIYDPYTTVFDPSAGKATRQPFPGNKIPAQRFDPLGALWMSGMLTPNRTPDNVTGLNNFSAPVTTVTDYWDLSDRVDWYATTKWRFFARPSWYRTNVLSPSPLQQVSPLYVEGGSHRDGFTTAAEAIWTVNATTIMDFHGDFRDFIDEYWSPAASGPNPIAKYWPNNNWWTPFAYPANVFPTYLPGIVLGGATTTLGVGNSNLWQQRPSGSSISARLSKMRGAHYIRVGFEERRTGGRLLAVAGNRFQFDPELTAETFLSPNTKLYGDQFATLLLGAISDTSQAVAAPLNHDRIIYYGAFIQDDYKPSRKVTVNIGLRYEYESPWHDPFYQMSRGPDFSVATPAVSQAPPQIPASITSMLNVPYSWTGSWVFTSSSNPGVWNSQKLVLMPRVGVAIRINDLTSLRFGYARYVTPSEMNYTGPPYGSFEAVNFMQPLYPGYDKQQSPLPLANGIPQAVVSNPFPAGANPLVAPGGRDQGAVVGLGTPNIGWNGSDYTRPVNDRFNLSLSHQLPSHIIVDATGFANFSHNLNYAYNLNQVDPRIIYQYKGATSVTVPNPFYNYLTPQQFSGQLRNLATVPITQLLVQRPQYGNLWEAFKPGAHEEYFSLDLKAQRPFSNGFNFLTGYSYIREKTQVLGTGTNQAPQVAGTGAWFLDPLNNYLDQLTYLDSPNPHHRVTIAGTYQLPLGKGRHFLTNTSRVLDGVVGGWQVIGAWYFQSGDYLRFGGLATTCSDPAISDPTPAHWFNTSCFSVLPPYTPRTNPDHYSDLRGPIFWDMQASLSKQFALTSERLKAELRISAYNLTNRLNRADPSTTVNDSAFGQSLRQYANYTGRQMEFGLRIRF